jgi:hypothetical protein
MIFGQNLDILVSVHRPANHLLHHNSRPQTIKRQRCCTTARPPPSSPPLSYYRGVGSRGTGGQTGTPPVVDYYLPLPLRFSDLPTTLHIPQS